MTKKQISALQRILEREAVDYKIRSGRPVPGQHPSEDKVAVSDGNICVQLDSFIPDLPVGEPADTFAQIIRREREYGMHLPVAQSQIKVSQWRTMVKQWEGQAGTPSVELAVPESAVQTSINPNDLPRAVPLNGKKTIVANFNPQLLIDAADVVGGKPQMFLGMGHFNSRYPSLLVFPSAWKEQSECGPIALVLPRRT